jgi:hypothetical protein
MSIWGILWIILMLFWLLGYCFVEPFNGRQFGARVLVPWLCVLLVGLVVLGEIAFKGP